MAILQDLFSSDNNIHSLWCYRLPTMNLMLALCVIGSLITVFFFFFFFLSHPICENLSPGALLYQAPAAAVILDMAGSRYRKTARAHSAQKNLEIPLIYPRLWLQSKPVAKKKKKKKEALGCWWGERPKLTTVSGLRVSGRRVLAIPFCGVAGRCSTQPCEPGSAWLGAAFHTAGMAELGPARGQPHAGRSCCRHPPLPAEKTPSRLPGDMRF